VEAEAALVRRERRERCGAAHVRHPGTGLRKTEGAQVVGEGDVVHGV